MGKRSARVASAKPWEVYRGPRKLSNAEEGEKTIVLREAAVLAMISTKKRMLYQQNTRRKLFASGEYVKRPFMFVSPSRQPTRK